MALSVKEIKVGSVYQFKHSQRRVVRIEQGKVFWEYADEEPHCGKRGGTQWIHRFRAEAKLLEGLPAPTRSQLEDRVALLEAELTKAQEQSRRLAEALKELEAQLSEMERPLDACVVMSTIHGMPYSGKSWKIPVEKARAALAEYDALKTSGD